MKRTALLLVAVLGLAVASSVQAADVNFKFFSQIGNAPVDTADDVHFTLMSADGDAVAFDSANADSPSVPAGSYTLIAEQPSTHLFGSTEVAVSDDDQAPRLFLMTPEGVQELVGVHECTNGRKPCKCDDSCICRVFNHNCTDRVCQCTDKEAAGYAGPASPSVPQTPSTPSVPPTSPYGPYGGLYPGLRPGLLGTLGLLGLLGLIDNEPKPVSAM
jgi:hypothetical protein